MRRLRHQAKRTGEGIKHYVCLDTPGFRFYSNLNFTDEAGVHLPYQTLLAINSLSEVNTSNQNKENKDILQSEGDVEHIMFHFELIKNSTKHHI